MVCESILGCDGSYRIGNRWSKQKDECKQENYNESEQTKVNFTVASAFGQLLLNISPEVERNVEKLAESQMSYSESTTLYYTHESRHNFFGG